MIGMNREEAWNLATNLEHGGKPGRALGLYRQLAVEMLEETAPIRWPIIDRAARLATRMGEGSAAVLLLDSLRKKATVQNDPRGKLHWSLQLVDVAVRSADLD